ncbi:MAG: oxygen-independent coproporphyrinogen III oxidase [Alphaproteobacteria bacterium]|nr:oxygen-independent coproporphyrinogen III oxidase [Alphaproteobacteria bacterium]
MHPDLLARYDRPVPRYTSYPTAPHFTADVDGATYRRWLGKTAPGTRTSLYLHIPFCHEMCWYCGCNTRVVRRPEPIASYVQVLIAEIDAVADALPTRLPVRHIHFGGGSPNTLAPSDLTRLINHLRDRFDIDTNAEIAVEIDPRTTTEAFIQACAAAGVTRASIGVQDLNADVQQAVNRIQPYDKIARVVAALNDAGVDDINVDLMYGLPHQTETKVSNTIDKTLRLAPDRVALFGYAHVPWMKKHMRLIGESALPDGSQRWRQFETAANRLRETGYIPVGMDHFARPGTALATAAEAGRLHRNFQGYTIDNAAALLGFGASAIGALPQGYVQNDPDVPRWHAAVVEQGLATIRGRALTDDDRERRAIIERLMCDMEVDLDEVATAHSYKPELNALSGMVRDGLVEIRGHTIRMTSMGQPLVRMAAAAFDRYLDRTGDAAPRHARAV